MYLFDTNVVSELRKRRRADARVRAWTQGTSKLHAYLSVTSVQEVELGILLRERKDRAQGAFLRKWFEESLLPAFAGRILPVDEAVARQCARLHALATRPDRDALIAATALVHGLTVVTRNTRDFEDTGVKLLNPWT